MVEMKGEKRGWSYVVLDRRITRGGITSRYIPMYELTSHHLAAVAII